MSLFPPTTSDPLTAAKVVLVPANRFFVQTVPLEPGAEAGTQTAYVLEEFSPFPPAQLYHGYLAAPDRSQALVFAAYRRRFPAAETEAWTAADLVLPAFVALLGSPSGGAELIVHAHGAGLTGVVWDGASALPAIVQAQAGAEPATDEQRAAFVAELRARSGHEDAPVRILEGEIGVGRDAESGFVFSVGEVETARFPAGALESADVRDKAFLSEQQQGRRRDQWLWRALLVAVAASGLATTLDLGALALQGWVGRRRGIAAGQAPQVQRIETAQALAERIENLASRRLRPFEMLGLINERRPRSIQFLRATTRGNNLLEVEAQTPNAADVGNYEAALRALPALARVETRDLRARENLLTFVLVVTFKPDAGRPEGGPG